MKAISYQLSAKTGFEGHWIPAGLRIEPREPCLRAGSHCGNYFHYEIGRVEHHPAQQGLNSVMVILRVQPPLAGHFCKLCLEGLV
jgi:hypothetical protein